MSSVNKVILLGNVGQDPQTRAVGSSSVCSFSLATSRTWKDKSGNKQEKTTWHRIQAWDKLGELCQEWVFKGRQVFVEGEIESREYEKDGQKHTAYEIRASEVQFLDSKGDGNRSGQGDGGSERPKWAGPAQPSPGAFTDDDLPF